MVRPGERFRTVLFKVPIGFNLNYIEVSVFSLESLN